MRAAAPEGAKLFTDNYLHWAAEERSRSTLVIPDLAGDPRPALAALVEVPGPWRRRIRVVTDSRADASFGPPSPLPMVRSEEHTSELQSLMRISYAVFCL